MNGATLAQRARRLRDLEEIHALFMTYGRALDAKDWDTYTGVFTDSAEFVAGIGTATGPGEIRALFEEGLKDVDPGYFHVFGNVAVDLDGDRATARSMWLYVCAGGDAAPRLLQCGHYDDELVRERGRWLFQRRAVTRAMGFPPYTR